MEEQIYIPERISKCTDYLSMCRFTNSDDFYNNIHFFECHEFSTIQRFIECVCDFLNNNGFLSREFKKDYLGLLRASDGFYVTYFFERTNKFEDLFKVPFTFNFHTIMNKLLWSFKRLDLLDELPF